MALKKHLLYIICLQKMSGVVATRFLKIIQQSNISVFGDSDSEPLVSLLLPRRGKELSKIEVLIVSSAW